MFSEHDLCYDARRYEDMQMNWTWIIADKKYIVLQGKNLHILYIKS